MIFTAWHPLSWLFFADLFYILCTLVCKLPPTRSWCLGTLKTVGGGRFDLCQIDFKSYWLLSLLINTFIFSQHMTLTSKWTLINAIGMTMQVLYQILTLYYTYTSRPELDIIWKMACGCWPACHIHRRGRPIPGCCTRGKSTKCNPTGSFT